MEVDPMQVEAVAREFSKVLRAWLTDEQMGEVVALNAGPGYRRTSVCASHNYVDANMAMAEAFVTLGHAVPDGPLDEFNYDVWNAAWDMAKANQFYPEQELIQ